MTQNSWLLHLSQEEICLVEMICTTVVPASKGHLGGASPLIFLQNIKGKNIYKILKVKYSKNIKGIDRGGR